jgi:SAM-dependent methyltransferase
MPNDDAPLEVAAWMRNDWEQRARTDAKRFINDREFRGFDFALSGCRDAYLILYQIQDRLRHDMRMLEIGCGIGRMLPYFACLFAEVHGIDVAPTMIAQARERLAAFRNVHLHLGSGRSLEGIADGSLDLVVSFQVFQHIPDRDVIADYVHESFRVLRPGGIMKILVKTKRWDGQGERHDTWCGVELGPADTARWAARDPWLVEDTRDDDYDPTKAWIVMTRPPAPSRA